MRDVLQGLSILNAKLQKKPTLTYILKLLLQVYVMKNDGERKLEEVLGVFFVLQCKNNYIASKCRP